MYHPLRNKMFAERDEIAEAVNELEDIELEIEALNLALQLEVRPRRSNTKN